MLMWQNVTIRYIYLIRNFNWWLMILILIDDFDAHLPRPFSEGASITTDDLGLWE